MNHLNSFSRKKAFLLCTFLLSGIFIFTNVAFAAPGGVSTGNTLWLKADSGTSTTTDGASISTWTDASPAADTITQGTGVNQPTYVSVGSNYNPSVNFNGTQFLTGINSTPLGGNDHAYTKFAIFNPTNLINYYNTLIASSSGNAMLWFNGGDSFPRLWHSGDFVTGTTVGLSIGKPSIVTGQYTGLSGNMLRMNNFIGASNSVAQSFTDGPVQIGTVFNNTNFGANGKIPEAITYNRALTSGEIQQVESYLAAKYGITLDQTSPTSYVASDGSTKMWDATGNSSYDDDIAVIGRDDAGGLNQKQSKSINTDDILAVGLGTVEVSNAVNANSFVSDKSFLSWGNNNGTVGWQLTGGPTSRRIISRTWKFQENNGDVGTVKISVPDNSAGGITLPIETTNVYALLDADGDFSSGATSITLTLNGTNWEGTTNIDPSTKSFLTFATETPSVTAPIFYLPFEGDYIDGTGNSNDGTNFGTTIVTDGTRGQVAEFTNTDYISVNTTLPTSFTKSAWVFVPNGTSIDYRCIICNGYGSNPQIFWANGEALKAGDLSAGQVMYVYEAINTFPKNSWQHVAVTYDTNTNRYSLYRNGALVSTAIAGVDPVDTTGPTLVGIFQAGFFMGWEGKMDDVSMWNTALTDVQIGALYTGDTGVIPPTPTAPDAPTALSTIPLNQKVKLYWTAPVYNGLSAITDYQIEWSVTGLNSWTTFTDGVSTTRSTTVTGLVNGTAYDFRVSAINAIGTGSPSTTDTETPINVNVPAPVFYLPFDGDYTDASGNGNNGTNFSSAIVTDATRGQVAEFDHGGTDYVSVDEDLPPSFTKSIWAFVPTGESMFYFHLMSNNTGNVLQNFYLSSTLLTAGNNPGGPINYVNDPVSFSTNTWSHVAVSYDNGTNTYKLYKDGILIDTGSANEDADASTPTTIASADGSVGSFWGKLDDAEMWNTVLDDTEIAAVYAGETGVSLTPTAPEPPYNISAHPVDSAVDLTWDIPAANGSPITDYIIEYSLAGMNSWNTFNDGVNTTLSTTVTGLTNETEYDFRIKAVNGIGTSSAGTVTAIAGLLTYFHVISTGQSLAVGAFSTPALSLSQPYNNLMFVDGLQGSITPLIPLIETGNGSLESPSSGIANSLRAYDTLLQRPVIVGLRAQGGTSYTGLKKGTTIYNDILNQVSTAKTAVDGLADNTFFKTLGVTLAHGEDDQYLGLASSYQANLEELQADYENDVNAITGSTDTLPLFISQMNTGWSSEVALAQYEAHKNNPNKIILIGPKYQYSYHTDNLHLSNIGSRYSGEMFAKVMKKVVIDGDTWNPLMPTALNRNGAVIVLDYNIPVGALVLDTTNMVQHTNYGFEFTQTGGNNPNISNVQLINSDSQVQITLDAVPTGTDQKIRYAWTCGLTPDPFAGRCADPTDPDAVGGNLRDSDSSISPASDGTGLPLYNWGVTFEEPITEIITADLSVTQNGDEAGTQSIIFTINLSQINTGGTKNFDFTVTGGTATGGGADYTNNNTQISVLNGSSTGTATITIIDDTLIEGIQTVTGTISNAPSGTVIGANSDTADIADDDELLIEFNSSNYNGLEAANTGFPVFSVSGAQSLSVISVEVAITANTASALSDFTFSSPVTINIPAANYITPQTLPFSGLSITDDDIDETNETINFLLQNPGANISVGAQSTTVYTITDDDTAGLSPNLTDSTTGENGSTGTIQMSLTSQPVGDITLNISSSNTAECTVPSSITILSADWNTPSSNIITVTGINDSLDDGDQTCLITVTSITSTSISDATYIALSNILIGTLSNQDDDVTVNQSSGGGSADNYGSNNNSPPPVIVPISNIFRDVPSNHPNSDAIRYVQLKGIINGYPDGTFRPDNKISRREFLKILIEATSDKETIENCETTKKFPDVDYNAWEERYICVAYEAQIVQGYEDGNFKPSDFITLPEAAKIIINSYKLSITKTDLWWEGYLKVFEAKNTTPETIHALWDQITRGEMAEIIYRLDNKIHNKTSKSFLVQR